MKMSIISTFESQCRTLTGAASPDENASRFLVGTSNPSTENSLYLFEYKDDNNSLAKVTFKFPFGETWHLSTSSKHPNLVAGVVGNKGKLSVGIYKLPDEFSDTIKDDYSLSESTIEQIFQPIPEAKNLVRQSHWQPDCGHQLITCQDGLLELWDVEQQKQARAFSLLNAVEKSLDIEASLVKPLHITDLRWSSLFNCSVVAAAVGSKIYGIDTRIDESSPASICWLIESSRCNRVRSIDFNPNSQYYVVSGGDDCRANFWDLRQTQHPALHLQAHTHWIWSIRYNPFHDQLVLSASSDARVALMRAQSTASEPYGQIADYEDDEEEEERDVGCGETEDESSSLQGVIGDETGEGGAESGEAIKLNNNSINPPKPKSSADEIIKVYEDHDDSVYAAEWATDPWTFASLGFESRLVINQVPKAEKFNILF